MKIVHKKISEFTDVITGGTPSTSKPEYWDGNVPWLNSGILNDGDVYRPSKFITELGLKNSAAKLMPQNTVLIALTGATTGQVGYLQIEASANQSVTGILPSKEHHPRYLYYYLRTKKQKVQGDAFGGAQPHINQQYVKDFTIPLPTLDDQVRIAIVLTRAERLIAKRKESIKALDELLKSTFLEIFGDPVRNEKGWEEKTAIDYADCIVPGRDKPKSFSGKIPWVTTDDLIHLGFTFKSKSNIGLTDAEIKEVKARVIPKDSVIITCVGDLGIATVAGDNMVVNQQLHAFQCNDSMSNIFFMHAISYQKAFMYKRATKTTVPYMNKTVCNNIPMMRPPLHLQNQFAAIVEKVESIKAKQAQSLAELENLYASLSQQAFKGELDLSRVPVVYVEAEPLETKSTISADVKVMKVFSKEELINT